MQDGSPPATGTPSHDAYIHDIKTEFTVILGNLQLVERRLRLGREISVEQLQATLAHIRQHAESAHGLVDALNLFHRQRQNPPDE
jgi:signal transduction histidine kinase